MLANGQFSIFFPTVIFVQRTRLLQLDLGEEKQLCRNEKRDSPSMKIFFTHIPF